MKDFTTFNIKDFETKPINLISKAMLITAGVEGDFNTMTASWGGLGFLWQRPVGFIFIRPQRYTLQFVEREALVTLSFFDDSYRNAMNICGTKSGRDTDKAREAGISPVKFPEGGIAFQEARYVFECKKLYADFMEPEHFIDQSIPEKIYPTKDFHKMFIIEIENAWQKTV